MEFSLLELLMSKSGEAFSRASILQEVWGYTPERHVDTRVVDVHISRLRSKLEEDPSNPDLILTARGTGYLFQKITETYNAYLSIFLDAHSNITLRTEIYDPDKFVCTVTALQMCVLLFGDVCSTDVYVLDGDGEISEEFSTDAAVEIVYPHLRSSASLH